LGKGISFSPEIIRNSAEKCFVDNNAKKYAPLTRCSVCPSYFALKRLNVSRCRAASGSSVGVVTFYCVPRLESGSKEVVLFNIRPYYSSLL